jgi:aryl-alcohol dehydrogenase-like predicted oxidoreductase
MKLRPLGRSGLQVSRVCLGGNVFGWTADEAMSHRLLDAWVDAGGNFVDTAEMYSNWVPGHTGGESEAVIGRWLAATGKRSRVVVATKCGHPSDRKGLGRTAIRTAVEGSLRRLQVETIDLYQAHVDDEATPLEETLSAFGELIAEGKVRAIGASNHTAPRLAEAIATSERLGLPRYESLQPHYNLVERPVYEDALEVVVREHRIGCIPYFGLARGFLTGKYRSKADATKSARGEGAAQYLDQPRGRAVLDALDAVSATLGAPTAAVALAWLADRPTITAPIASATSLEQLQTLVVAAELQLDAPSIALLDRASGS